VLPTDAQRNHAHGVGPVSILNGRITGLFASRAYPVDVVLPSLDLARGLRDEGATVVSGFHSKLENDCLHILSRGNQPIVYCPAKRLEDLRLPRDLRGALDGGRLVVVSPPSMAKLTTRKTAESRNRFIAGLADTLLVLYASREGALSGLISERLSQGSSVYVVDCVSNSWLIEKGAKAVDESFWLRVGRV
jgi:hypothetical protein